MVHYIFFFVSYNQNDECIVFVAHTVNKTAVPRRKDPTDIAPFVPFYIQLPCVTFNGVFM